jgi:hypothetical protein
VFSDLATRFACSCGSIVPKSARAARHTRPSQLRAALAAAMVALASILPVAVLANLFTLSCVQGEHFLSTLVLYASIVLSPCVVLT